jgi:adenylate cyclase
MIAVCAKHRGTINEIIGDALLVTFGVPLAFDDHAHRAVACALEMLKTMDVVNKDNLAKGYPELEMGIGLHTGAVVVGNIGSKQRAKYGVDGSDVNLASRIESYTVGGQVLISEPVKQQIGDLLRIESSMEVQPKGVKGTLNIYEVSGIGGEYNVYLDQAEERFAPLTKPIEVVLNLIDGKDNAAESFRGQLRAMSDGSAEMVSPADLKKLANIRLLVQGVPDLGAQDIYAKVTRSASDVHVIRFTSVPKRVEEYFAQAKST